MRAWQPTSVFLPGESPGTEEPGELSPRGHKESDTTERLSTQHIVNKITHLLPFLCAGRIPTVGKRIQHGFLLQN